VGSRAGLDWCGKSRPHQDSILGPSSPYMSRRIHNKNSWYTVVISEVNCTHIDNSGRLYARKY